MWEHKGFKIELSDATFVSTINGKVSRCNSLAAAKKKIDKHLDAKLKEIALDLPVVVAHEKRFSGSESHIIRRSVMSGIDQSSLEVTGIRFEGYSTRWILPDCEDNAALLERYYDTQKIAHEVEVEISRRAVSTYMASGYGGKKIPYADAVKRISDSYADALKGEA